MNQMTGMEKTEREERTVQGWEAEQGHLTAGSTEPAKYLRKVFVKNQQGVDISFVLKFSADLFWQEEVLENFREMLKFH